MQTAETSFCTIPLDRSVHNYNLQLQLQRLHQQKSSARRLLRSLPQHARDPRGQFADADQIQAPRVVFPNTPEYV
jgi:hypothetical protein